MHIPATKRTKEEEERIIAALDKVGVAFLIDREGWETIKRWEDTLSLGEQQRIGIARLFYHLPAFGILDECTDAVSVDVEKSLYERLHAENVTCITISKRIALEEFHTKHLMLGVSSKAGWRCTEID